MTNLLQILKVKATTNGGWPEQEGTLCNNQIDENCSNDVPVKPYTAPLYQVSLQVLFNHKQ
jgi:hypothetical protein